MFMKNTFLGKGQGSNKVAFLLRNSSSLLLSKILSREKTRPQVFFLGNSGLL